MKSQPPLVIVLAFFLVLHSLVEFFVLGPNVNTGLSADRNVFNRNIPPKNAYNRVPPLVVLKLDVEGSVSF